MNMRFLLAIAAMLALIGTLAWWASPPGSPATIQGDITEHIAAICTSAVWPDSYDSLDIETLDAGNQSGVLERNYRTNGQADHNITSLDGKPIQEAIFIFLDNDGRPALRHVSEVRRNYFREFGEKGWGDWNVIVQETRTPYWLGIDPSLFAERDDEDYETFCGLPLELPEDKEVDFRYVGEETIDGVLTHHFFHAYALAGYGDFESTEHWYDLEGLIRKTRRVSYIPSEHRLEQITTYSGFGEANIITEPDYAGPLPTPVPFQIPARFNTPTP